MGQLKLVGLGLGLVRS